MLRAERLLALTATATPQVLADEARALAEANGLWVDVLDEKRADELGMGMFLAVGQGSANPPRMIVLRSGDDREADAAGRRLALVGKGVCFDSGGISIKSAERMDEMKTDKTGACTVISAIVTAARLAPGTPLLAIAPAVENMPGPGASRPGDVVRAMNGKAVDIINTDAEGRLILGDAMTYAEHLGATKRSIAGRWSRPLAKAGITRSPFASKAAITPDSPWRAPSGTWSRARSATRRPGTTRWRPRRPARASDSGSCPWSRGTGRRWRA